MNETLKASDLPDVGSRRFWNIKHRAHRTEPVVVELRESTAGANKNLSFSRVIGFDYTIADIDSVKEAAERVRIRVGNIDAVVGVF